MIRSGDSPRPVPLQDGSLVRLDQPFGSCGSFHDTQAQSRSPLVMLTEMILTEFTSPSTRS